METEQSQPQEKSVEQVFNELGELLDKSKEAETVEELRVILAGAITAQMDRLRYLLD
jgi:hypothetical protein